nr:MAG TPA: hypothetical protein [Caudoviricetes sp.]
MAWNYSEISNLSERRYSFVRIYYFGLYKNPKRRYARYPRKCNSYII